MRGGPTTYTSPDPALGDPAAAIGDYARWTYDHYQTPNSLGLYRASIEAASLAPDTAAYIRDNFSDSVLWPSHYLSLLVQKCPLEIDDIRAAATDIALIAVNGTAHLMGWPAVPERFRPTLAEWASTFFLSGYPGLCALPTAREDVPQPFSDLNGLFDPLVEATGRRALATDRRDRLHQAAMAEFIAHGMNGASIDAISRASGVGKMTIYRHYADKRALFIGVVDQFSRALYESRPDDATSPPSASKLPDTLASIGKAALARFISDANIDLYRLMIREAPQFPELALTIFRRSNAATVSALRACLLSQPGLPPLSSGLVDYLALQFITLLTNANKFLALPIRPQAAEQERMVARAVKLFLRGYQPANPAARASSSSEIRPAD
ncbi:MAG: TetR/AcrR family transcriptional regulator [Sphingomonadaceae bacterium]